MSTYQTYTHPSGLRILLTPSPGAPVTYLGIGILVGSVDEPTRYHGLAHSIEHMLFKGTQQHSASAIIQQVEGVGGELNAFTTKEDTTLYAITPSAYATTALRLLLELVSQSTFPEDEWEKEQTVIIEEIHSYEDSPSEHIFDEFDEQVLRGTPLGHAILGSESSVGRITTAVQRRFFAQHYRPERMALFVHGDYSLSTLLEEVERVYPSPSTPRLPRLREISPQRPFAPSKRQVRRQGNSQSHVLLGAVAYHRDHPKRFALSLLANILGGPAMNAQLNDLLRETHGLVYHIEANYIPYTDTGLFNIYFGSSRAKEAQALELVEELLRQHTCQAIEEEAFHAALTQLSGQLLISSENKEQQFLSLGKGYLHRDRYESNEELLEHFACLTPQDLQAVAQEIFAPTRLHTLVYR